MEDEFEILAAKVLAGEASAEEHSRLREILSQSAELRQDFAELAATWKTMCETGPLAKALHAPPTPIPKDRLKGLQEVVRERFPARATKVESARAEKESVQSGFLWQWLRKTSDFLPLPASLAMLLLVIAGAFLLINRPRGKNDPTSAEAAPVAYFLAVAGHAEVRHDG